MSVDKIPGFITVRTSSSRLPNKCLMDFGGKTVLEHVVGRAIHYNIDPIICTSTDSSDDRIESLAKKMNCKLFRGSLDDKLNRWYECANVYKLDAFHTVDADDLFFCGREMHRSYELLYSEKLDMVKPSLSSSGGGGYVGYSITVKALTDVLSGIEPGKDTEMIEPYFEKVKSLKVETLSEPDQAAISERMTLDYYEDYILFQTIRLILGDSPEREEIYSLFKNNPDLCLINKSKNLEWAAKQSKKVNDARSVLT